MSENIFEEAVDCGIKLHELVPSCDSMCRLIEGCVKTAVETKSPLVHYQCMRITGSYTVAVLYIQNCIEFNCLPPEMPPAAPLTRHYHRRGQMVV
jgi:hypothetical protein